VNTKNKMTKEVLSVIYIYIYIRERKTRRVLMEKIFFWLQKVIAVIFFPRQGLLEEEPKKMLLQILRFGFSEEDFFSHLHVLEEEVISAAKANLFSQVCLRKMK
jgi:hypothetical protein